MDSRKGKRFVFFEVGEIEEYINCHPEKYETKRGFELLAGCILSKYNNKNTGYLLSIGYNLKRTYSGNDPSLKEIFELDIIEDSDVDIYLKYKNNNLPFIKVQITRLEEYRSKNNEKNALFELIDKKLLIQKDEKLILVVLGDYSCDIEFNRIKSYFEKKDVPYGYVYIIGQFGEEPKRGKYNLIEIYPDLREPEEFITLNIK